MGVVSMRETSDVLVRFETDVGNIEIVVNTHAAPNTARYFLDLVDAGHFNDVTFHRAGASFSSGSERMQIIEGGAMYRSLTGEDRRPLSQVGLPLLVDFETTTQSGLAHIRGTVSLARDLTATGNAIPDVFICLETTPAFDEGGRTEPDTRGFPAFAMVTGGMDVVDLISKRDRSGATRVSVLRGQILAEPVKILKTVRMGLCR